MTADLELVTRLQSIDLKIAELQREVSTLPKHIAQIEMALDSHLRRLDADRAALAGNLKDRKQCEDNIKVQEQKATKFRDQMQQAKTNEQFKAFQHEIEFCEKEVRQFEDRILELMTEAEPLDANAQKATAALKQEKIQVDSEKAKAMERTAVDKREIDRLQGERATAVAALPKPVLAAYERIRKKWSGVVLAEAAGGRCTACQITIRPQFFQDLKKADSMMFCESCGRILFYNPPVSFEHDLAAHPGPHA